MTTLADLLVAPTQDQILTELYNELAARAFPVTNWQSGGIERTIVESIAAALADFSGPLASTVATWGFLEEATGDALTVLCRSNFETTRKPATFALWTITLQDGGAGPYTILPGQLWAQNAAGLNFNNVNGGVLPASGTLILTFKAESPGASYNAGPVNILATPLAGVTITTNVLAESAVNEESDEQLRERARLIWANLGAGSTRAAYERNALDSDTTIRRVLVQEDLPTPGDVLVTVAAEDDTASGPAVAAALAYLTDDVRRPLCTFVSVVAAGVTLINVTATVTILAASQPAAAAIVNTRLLELLRNTPISDGTESVFFAALIEVLMQLDGAINAVITVPAGDTALPSGNIAKLGAVAITWVNV